MSSSPELKNPTVIEPYLNAGKFGSYGGKAVMVLSYRDAEEHLLRVFIPEFGLWLGYHTLNAPPISGWQDDLLFYRDTVIIVNRQLIRSLDLATMEWSSKAYTGDITEMDAVCVHDDNIWLYNRDGLFSCNLSLEPYRWIRPVQHGDIPSQRQYATLTNIGNDRAVLFGGRSLYPSYTTYNEIHVLHLPTLTWTKIHIQQESKPLSRGAHAAVPLDGRRIAIIGGIYKSVERSQFLNDVWILDTEIWQWTQIHNPPHFRPGIVHAAFVQDNIYIFDGERVAVIKGKKYAGNLKSLSLRALAKSEIPISKMIYSPSPNSRIPISNISIPGLTALKLMKTEKGERVDKDIIDISSVTSLKNLEIDMV